MSRSKSSSFSSSDSESPEQMEPEPTVQPETLRGAGFGNDPNIVKDNEEKDDHKEEAEHEHKNEDNKSDTANSSGSARLIQKNNDRVISTGNARRQAGTWMGVLNDDVKCYKYIKQMLKMKENPHMTDEQLVHLKDLEKLIPSFIELGWREKNWKDNPNAVDLMSLINGHVHSIKNTTWPHYHLFAAKVADIARACLTYSGGPIKCCCGTLRFIPAWKVANKGTGKSYNKKAKAKPKPRKPAKGGKKPKATKAKKQTQEPQKQIEPQEQKEQTEQKEQKEDDIISQIPPPKPKTRKPRATKAPRKPRATKTPKTRKPRDPKEPKAPRAPRKARQPLSASNPPKILQREKIESSVQTFEPQEEKEQKEPEPNNFVNGRPVGPIRVVNEPRRSIGHMRSSQPTKPPRPQRRGVPLGQNRPKPSLTPGGFRRANQRQQPIDLNETN